MRFASLFDLRSLADATFELAECPESAGRLLGGALIASSVAAASRTVSASRRPVSSQTTFVRGGRVAQPVTLSVSEVHDGRLVATRSVTALQGKRVIATSTIRFQTDEPEEEAWQAEPRQDLCPPEHGRSEDAVLAVLNFLDDFEIRAAVSAPERPVIHPYWARSIERPPAVAATNEALLALLTDMGVSASASAPGARLRERIRSVSLDHCLWWHRPVQVDQWLCIDAQPLVNHGGRGLARGTVHDLEGRLVASFSQEVLLRPGPPKES